MILWFRFQNYGPFLHNTLVSLQAGIYREHPEHLVLEPAGRLLKTLAVYGPNSSGKSQLIRALAFFTAFVRRQLPFSFSPDSLWNLSDPGLPPGLSNARCPEPEASGHQPLSMSMRFLFGGHVFEYGFALENGALSEEYLLLGQTLLFQKEQTSLRPGKFLRPLFKRDVQLNTSGSGLPVIFACAPESLGDALESFAAFFREGCFFFLSSDSIPVSAPLFPPAFTGATSWLGTDKEQRFLLRHLKTMGFPAEPDIQSLLSGISLDENYGTQSRTLPLSDGHRKVLLFLRSFSAMSKNGGVIIADDFTAHLHPNVSRCLVQLIQSPENRCVQLLFTTHDTALLNRELFRRDEAAILCLDAQGHPRIRTLADIHARFDANFAKNYLAGKYGCLPVWAGIYGEQGKDGKQNHGREGRKISAPL